MDIAISAYQEALLKERAKRQRVVNALIEALDGQVTGALAALSSSSIELSATATSMSGTAEQGFSLRPCHPSPSTERHGAM